MLLEFVRRHRAQAVKTLLLGLCEKQVESFFNCGTGLRWRSTEAFQSGVKRVGLWANSLEVRAVLRRGERARWRCLPYYFFLLVRTALGRRRWHRGLTLNSRWLLVHSGLLRRSIFAKHQALKHLLQRDPALPLLNHFLVHSLVVVLILPALFFLVNVV
jgi:hypothetical protein